VKLTEAARDQRFDHAIQRALAEQGHDVSIREVRSAIKDGRILIDGRRRAPGDRARGIEDVGVESFIPRKEAKLDAEIELLASAPVIFEDEHLLILSKPSGMPTAPLRPGEKGTLLGAAVARVSAIGSIGPPLEGGLLHRLDTETSGLVLFAKDETTRARVRAELSGHAIEKRYLALVIDREGAIPDDFVAEGAILSRGERVRVVEPDHDEALPARTALHVLRRLRAGFTWIEATTKTGRRHQIRAHLADRGAPIVGDKLYGSPGPSDPIRRLALHASRIVLPDGRAFEAPLPSDLGQALESLGGA
jgi:23S rRNA pseudouridine1911/1915/1917 synthase